MKNKNAIVKQQQGFQLFIKEFDRKVKSMPNVRAGLPTKSLKRIAHDDDISFYESVN